VLGRQLVRPARSRAERAEDVRAGSNGGRAARRCCVVAGADFACALTKAKEVYCWGGTQSGAVTGVKMPGSSIRVKPPLSGPAKSLAAGLNFACAIVTGTSDAVHCWGSNGVQQLGTSDVAKTFNDPLLPFAGPFDRVVAAGQRACVIKRARMACWGANPNGELTGLTTGPLPPTEVSY
jgi:alpha-tubulin suppressor-like RCC1 family protein